MDGIIETERLLLRKFNVRDAEEFFLLNNDPVVMKYTGDKPFISVTEAEQFIRNYDHYAKFGYGRFTVIEKRNDEFLGWCGLKFHEPGYVDLGFRFHRKHWNMGFATEAAKGCLDYGFIQLRLTEIIGRVADKNQASIKVLTKLGMKYWKKDECNGIENALYYKIVSQDY